MNPLHGAAEELAQTLQQSLEKTIRNLQDLQQGVVKDLRESCGQLAARAAREPAAFEEMERRMARQQEEMAARLEAMTRDLASSDVFSRISQSVEDAAKTLEEILKKMGA